MDVTLYCSKELPFRLGTILMREGPNASRFSSSEWLSNCPKLTVCIAYFLRISKFCLAYFRALYQFRFEVRDRLKSNVSPLLRHRNAFTVRIISGKLHRSAALSYVERIAKKQQLEFSRCLSTECVALDEVFSSQNRLRVTNLLQDRLVTIREQKKKKKNKKLDDVSLRARVSAVLVPFCSIEDQPALLFTRRSAKLISHRGEIRFGYYSDWVLFSCAKDRMRAGSQAVNGFQTVLN